MLVISPREVTFDGERWEGVSLIAVDRRASRRVVEWSDAGPHAVFADVAEEAVTLRIVQENQRDDPGTLRPGREGELRFEAGVAGTDAGRIGVRARCVVTDVTHEIGLKRGCVREVRLAALSDDGAADPITTEAPH